MYSQVVWLSCLLHLFTRRVYLHGLPVGAFTVSMYSNFLVPKKVLFLETFVFKVTCTSRSLGEVSRDYVRKKDIGDTCM